MRKDSPFCGMCSRRKEACVCKHLQQAQRLVDEHDDSLVAAQHVVQRERLIEAIGDALIAAAEAETEALRAESARIKATLDYVHSEMLHQWGHAGQAHEEGDDAACAAYAECGDRLHDVWVRLGGPEVAADRAVGSLLLQRTRPATEDPDV